MGLFSNCSVFVLGDFQVLLRSEEPCLHGNGPTEPFSEVLSTSENFKVW